MRPTMRLDLCRPDLCILGLGRLGLGRPGLGRLESGLSLGDRRLGRPGRQGRLEPSRLPVRLAHPVQRVHRGRRLVRGFLPGFGPAWPRRCVGGSR